MQHSAARAANSGENRSGVPRAWLTICGQCCRTLRTLRVEILPSMGLERIEASGKLGVQPRCQDCDEAVAWQQHFCFAAGRIIAAYLFLTASQIKHPFSLKKRKKNNNKTRKNTFTIGERPHFLRYLAFLRLLRFYSQRNLIVNADEGKDRMIVGRVPRDNAILHGRYFLISNGIS